ncbi:hypothetical protein CKM354_000108700 [Cercospora kikuchii]|uniref:Uncharacterized protein n=1 Tax=Cercospora kikuchii TaxID=84275 RepID=A0A9P3CCR9_9PEZI|nr:uncharacterized protein CKM354_000108700 [Cercospora kikuchii]GIZ37645.1 hypothetical protein CKM354_000108700 [Cercospora kikuchii]
MRCSSLTMLAFGALASAMPYPNRESTGSIKSPSPDSTTEGFRSAKARRQFEFGSLIDYWNQKAQAAAHEKDPPSTLSKRSQEEDMLELSWAPIQARHLRKRDLYSSASTSAAGSMMLIPAVTLSDPHGHTTSSLLKARTLTQPPPPSNPFPSSSDKERKQHPELTWAPIQAKRDLVKRSNPAAAYGHGLEYATSIRPTSSSSQHVAPAKPRHRRTQAVDFGSPTRLRRDEVMETSDADALVQDLLEQAAALTPTKAKKTKKRDAELSNARWEEIGDVMKQRRRDWRANQLRGSASSRVVEV